MGGRVVGRGPNGGPHRTPKRTDDPRFASAILPGVAVWEWEAPAETAAVVELDRNHRMRTHGTGAACRGAAVGGARDMTGKGCRRRGETNASPALLIACWGLGLGPGGFVTSLRSCHAFRPVALLCFAGALFRARLDWR